MLNYEEVPNTILTGKDLDYLSDMFEWNYSLLKQINNAIDLVDDEEIVSYLVKGVELFDNNLNSVLTILESRGNSNE